MKKSASTAETLRGDGQWAVVVLLLVVVLLPSATVLWLTSAAVRNERAAVRSQLVSAYQRHLELATTQIDDHWAQVDRQCAALAKDASPAELFEACVKAELADAVLILAPGGGLAYPTAGTSGPIDSMNEAAWQAALRLEFRDDNPAVAAEAFAAIAAVEPDPDAEARAWLAHARCLQKQGRSDQAIEVLSKEFNRPSLRLAVDQNGRSLWIDAQLRALQLLIEEVNEPAATTITQQREALHEALSDYRLAIPASQRLFAMNELLQFDADAQPFSTYRAESLAAQYANRLQDPERSPSIIRGLAEDQYSVTMASTPVVLLFDPETLQQRMRQLLSPWQTEDARSTWVWKDSNRPSSERITAEPIPSMPGHRLVLELSNPNFFEDSTRRQTSLYTLAGMITIAIVAVIAVAIAFFVRRQLRLAQLKNDLAAVVTHELRTPLASIRLLVDTLLEGAADDPQQRTEYLGLIARENERLSRVIENFLNFAQAQGNRQRFVFQETSASELIERAIAATGGKLKEPGCKFSCEGCQDLPRIEVDPDAMVMVLLNLLDNAVKFTGPEKTIGLRSAAENGTVTFQVSDNGIGMTPAETRRAFEKFYQADTRLSRNHGGCGLGLSLVRSIVEAHGGTVEVDSMVDQGSTFTVQLPITRKVESDQTSVSV